MEFPTDDDLSPLETQGNMCVQADDALRMRHEFLVIRAKQGKGQGDRFASDCVAHQTVLK